MSGRRRSARLTRALHRAVRRPGSNRISRLTRISLRRGRQAHGDVGVMVVSSLNTGPEHRSLQGTPESTWEACLRVRRTACRCLFGESSPSGNGKAVWAVVTRYGCGRGEFFEGCERMGGWRPPPRLWPSSFGSGSEGGNGKSKTLRTSRPEVGCNKPTDATCGGNR